MGHPKLPGVARTLVLTAAVAFALSLAPGGAPMAHAIAAPYAPDEVVVRVLPGASIEALNADYGTATIRELVVTTGAYLLSTPPGEDAAVTVARMRGDARLDFVEPNYLSGAPEASPRKIQVWGGFDAAPAYEQYALDLLDLGRAHGYARGAGVTVAVIDTGVQLDHPALAGRLLPGFDFVDGDRVPQDVPDGLDDDADGLVDEALGHGTHVAGIVALTAPEAAILPLRALNADGVGDVYSVAMAIEYAVASGARIINLSLGTDLETDLLRDVVLAAARAGVLVVAAAGNGDASIPEYPAADPCAVGVTSVDAERRLAPESAYGPWVDLAAPGESIYSALIPGGYGWWSGTSMAAPFVSGAAALAWSARPELKLRQIASLAVLTGGDVDGGGLADTGHIQLIDPGQALAFAAAGHRISSRQSFIPAECTLSVMGLP